jgi:hypothetical protein
VSAIIRTLSAELENLIQSPCAAGICHYHGGVPGL